MTARAIHVIGAGLSGLAAAMSLAEAGRSVTLHEAGPAAGGRCRSYFDKALGRRIDNGNHLLLSGNTAVAGYLDRIGAADSLIGPEVPAFPFLDRADGTRWVLRPNLGRVPWWIFDSNRRVPGTRLRDYLALARLRTARGTVEEALGRAGPLYRRLLEPLAVAGLNTPADTAYAPLLQAVVAETLARGGAACRPLVPREGLSETFVDPALAWLARKGATIRFGHRLQDIQCENGRVARLIFADESEEDLHGGAAVLAVPPPVAADLLPDLVVPEAFEAIVNLHFIDAQGGQGTPGTLDFVGLVGGLAEWIFRRAGILSVTISAANRFAEDTAESLATRCWADIRAAYPDVPEAMPAYRLVREKRATFAATAEQEQRRPRPSGCDLANLALAGDWTRTGLPATIEGSIRSGNMAAAHLLRHN